MTTSTFPRRRKWYRKPLVWVGGFMALIFAGVILLGIFGSDPNKVTSPDGALAKCAQHVTYYANKAPKGSDQFGPTQKSHSRKEATKRFAQKMCSDPLFAATTIDFAKNGAKIDDQHAEAQARKFAKNHKAWAKAVIGFFDKGTKTNKVKNPKYAVTGFSVENDKKHDYRTLGMVPHKKKMPTLVKSRQTHKVGWALVLKLKSGKTREFRISCDFQPVSHDFSNVPAAPKKSTSKPKKTHAVSMGCTGSKCGSGHNPPPPSCKSTNSCSPPPGCKQDCSNNPPPCTKDCGNPPPPKCTTDCSPPKHDCPCVTKAQVQQPVQDNSHVMAAAVAPTKDAPKQAPPVQDAKPVNNRVNHVQAPDPTPNGSDSGSSDGHGTPSGSTSDHGGTTTDSTPTNAPVDTHQGGDNGGLPGQPS